MRLQSFKVEHYRSIENAEVIFPENIPVILFGPNNVGKSNILKALDCVIGEKHPSYIDFQDSDYFKRDKTGFPNIKLTACFDESLKQSDSRYSILRFETNHKFQDWHGISQVENTYHFEDGAMLYLKNEDKEKCQFILIDATRDISRQLSYFSQYSLLSKMSKRMHEALLSSTRGQLDENFESLKQIFESVPEYKEFHTALQKAFNSNADGFEHKLEIDLSAYDPNNYFHSLRIIAKDSIGVRSFDEFGTGEQQILLMSFVKAYAETFKSEHFVLGIEEPEAHLHPLAQKWLSKNLISLSKTNIQILITTHSPEFLDIDNLEGFVKVYKENEITKIIQHTPSTLASSCIQMAANAEKTNENTVLPFYKTNTFYDQLRGFFARKIILVEGESEFFSLPNYFERCGHDLIKSGVEIINCRGKGQIARNYRLFKSFGYDCFSLFDADNDNEEKQRGNKELSELYGFNVDQMSKDPKVFTFDERLQYGYFGKDFESYLRANLSDYGEREGKMPPMTKVMRAKIISETFNYKPEFIGQIYNSLFQSQKPEDRLVAREELKAEDIPF